MYLPLKRATDIALSVLALALLSPVFALLFCAITIDSPGSPLFIQPRVGKNGRVFPLLKFRSMVKDAATKGPYWTSDKDSRITRVGRILRVTSLDELPQLWNVAMGDMSLIGPRPDVPAQEALYTPEQWQQRHRVRPGITGLAQVSGRSDLTPRRRLAYDLFYAGHVGFRLDMVIAIKTVWMVLRQKGVN